MGKDPRGRLSRASSSLAVSPRHLLCHARDPPPQRRRLDGLAAFSQLQPVAVRIHEHRDIAPRVLEHSRLELHAARLQCLERLPAIRRLDRARCRGAAFYRLGLPGSPWPEHELKVLTLDSDGEEPRSIGRRVIGALLEAEEPRVEVARLVLIAYELRYVHHFRQQHESSSRVGRVLINALPVIHVTNGGETM